MHLRGGCSATMAFSALGGEEVAQTRAQMGPGFAGVEAENKHCSLKGKIYSVMQPNKYINIDILLQCKVGGRITYCVKITKPACLKCTEPPDCRPLSCRLARSL